ncbi:thioredoxin family protein [Pontiella sp.]|uniref:thioredoxin family protein n=1 Tax=Pontiella sp. TaxID=2837462 RepID=UPI003569ABF4
MKIKTIMGSALLAGTLTAQAGLGIGDAMVDANVKMKNIDGSEVTLAGVKGEKGTLVIFTCNQCPFVEAWQKTMVELGNTYSQKGFGVVFVNSNDPSAKGDTLENMKAMAKKEGYGFPYVQDATSNVARNFGATKTPDVFLFDAADKLVYKGAVGEGGRSVGDEIWLKDALDALLAGKPIATSETKAIGCGIKFR